MDGLLFAGATAVDDVTTYLEAEGFDVDVVKTTKDLKRLILEERPRMIVLTDSNVKMLETVRAIDRMVPVMVAAEADAPDTFEAEALGAGADAFVRRPLSGAVCAAWVEAMFRRLERCPFGQERYAFGDVEVDVFRRTVKKRAWRLMMSATEFDLLVHLIRNNGRIVSREEILREVWKYDTCPTTRTVDNFICKLRRKIDDSDSGKSHLKTVKGTGYRFDLEAD